MTISLQSDNPALQDFFLARQPILNRDQRLVAYELLFRSTAENQAMITGDAVAATATVIAHASDLGMEQVVGLQLAFINVDAVALMSDFIGFLPHHRVVLEILETVRPTPPCWPASASCAMPVSVLRSTTWCSTRPTCSNCCRWST